MVLVVILTIVFGASSYSIGRHSCASDIKACEASVLEQVNDNRLKENKAETIEEWRQGK